MKNKTQAQKNKARGDYYVGRTILYLKKYGYLVEKMERSIPMRFGGRLKMIRSDIWFSDLIALSSENIILVQVKFNSKGNEGNNISTAKKNYRTLPSPIGLLKWVVEWNPGMSEPKIEVVG